MVPNWVASEWFHFLLLLIVPWITYWTSLWGQFVSDDHAGIEIYRGNWKDPDPAQSPNQWKPSTFSFHTVWRQIRWWIGKTPPPEPGHPFLQRPLPHHRLNLYLASGVGGLLYLILLRWVGDPTAFLATLLFLVHPIGVQTCAWISGVGYSLAVFLSLAAFNIVGLSHDLGWNTSPLRMTLALLLFSLFQFGAIQAQFAVAGLTFVLLFLGEWPFAIVAAVWAFLGCAGTLKSAVELRRKVFEEQQLGDSTRFHLWKFVIVMKSWYYYLKLSLFPKRLGLYHTFGYHYELPKIELEDHCFWLGLGLFLLSSAAVVWAPPPIPFGLVWFLAFILPFLNWITAHQFVSERYCWFPTAGLCLIVASVAPTTIYWIVFGVALMRVWCHLPTFDDEINFYWSNIWNFPQSEVAYGNLGVVYNNMGLPGAGLDIWRMGIRLNPDYDVNWYNLGSTLRTQGVLSNENPNSPGARECFVKALSARICHFPEMWKRELAELDRVIEDSHKHRLIVDYLNMLRADPVNVQEAIKLSKALEQVATLSQQIKAQQEERAKQLREQLSGLQRSEVELAMRKNSLALQQEQVRRMTETGVLMQQQRAALESLWQAIQARKAEQNTPASS